MSIHPLLPRTTPAASVTRTAGGGWLLSIPDVEAGKYTVSQLDDYAKVSRRQMGWTVPSTLSLRARVSEPNLPGTWGFGLWNDPFSFSLGLGGMARRLPALPNAAWFFYSSEQNYLSFRPSPSALPRGGRGLKNPSPFGGGAGVRETLPHNGFLAQTFQSPKIPTLLLAPGAVMLPLLAIKPFARLARWILSKFIREDSIQLGVDATQFHGYRLEWGQNQAIFSIDGETVLETEVSPSGPLALVIWIDNQYAAFTPEGIIKAGTLASIPAWLEIEDLRYSIGQ